jgi:hypothetical protein
LADGSWIAAFLVAGAEASLSVASAAQTPAQTVGPGSAGGSDIMQLPAPANTPVTSSVVAVAPTATPEVSAALPSNSSGGAENPNTFQCSGGCAEPPDPSCAIKGNVNSQDERIYHTASSSNYEKTNIKLEEGDRWFCTEQEAVEAGFRAPRN